MAIDSLQLMQAAATRIFDHFADARRADETGQPRVAQAARDKAGTELMKVFGTWMDRFYQRRGVHEDDAGDMTQDAMLRLVAYSYEVRGNAFALICRARVSVLVEHWRRRGAGKRRVGTSAAGDQVAEVLVGDESWEALSETVAADELPAELIDCVQRKMHLFREISAARAEVLELHVMGLSAREIASVIYDKPEAEVTKGEERNMRARVYDMKDQVQALFLECKD
jgi:DNA-directed RNA polymerase specialized sigma24 family protein